MKSAVFHVEQQFILLCVVHGIWGIREDNREGQGRDGLSKNTFVIVAFALPICSVHFIFLFIIKNVRNISFPMGMFRN